LTPGLRCQFAGTAGGEAVSSSFSQQGRQDSNLQPPVLETGALPIELRPWAPRIVALPSGHPRLMTETERETEVLEEEQEGKGYGEDEGERDESLPEGEQE
jgi:hypothetical protein